MTLVPPYDHPHVIAGQGTAAKELIDEVGELDMLVAPLGGGGLSAGLRSALPAIFRMRMENGRLKRDLRAVRENPAVVDQPPMPPVI